MCVWTRFAKSYQQIYFIVYQTTSSVLHSITRCTPHSWWRWPWYLVLSSAVLLQVAIFPNLSWLLTAVWSVNTDWWYSICYLSLVYFISSSCLTSFICSFSLTPYLLPVSLMYTFEQFLQGMESTTPAVFWEDLLSLGCTESCLRILWGFINVALQCLLIGSLQGFQDSSYIWYNSHCLSLILL